MPNTIPAKEGSGGKNNDQNQTSEDVHVREPLTLILPDNNQFSSFLFSTFKRSTNAVLILLIVASIPVTMVLISRPQDVRQRADFQTSPQVTQKYNVSGKIYVDTNNNGTRDSWENGPQGAVILVTNENIKIEVPTDTFGNYSFGRFGGLLPGFYTVSFNTPGGYSPTAASTINIKLGPENAVVDFGVKRSSLQSSPKL